MMPIARGTCACRPLPSQALQVSSAERSQLCATVQVDVWSLGVLAYELLTTQLPYSGASMLDTLQRIMLNRLAFPPGLGPLARDFMARCLQARPCPCCACPRGPP